MKLRPSQAHRVSRARLLAHVEKQEDHIEQLTAYISQAQQLLTMQGSALRQALDSYRSAVGISVSVQTTKKLEAFRKLVLPEPEKPKETTKAEPQEGAAAS